MLWSRPKSSTPRRFASSKRLMSPTLSSQSSSRSDRFLLCLYLIAILLITFSTYFSSFIISSFQPSTCSNPIPQSVAVCITGTTRSFHYPLVYNNIRHTVINALRRFYHTDVFFVISVDDERKNNQTLIQSPREQTLKIMSTFSPAKIVEYGVTDYLNDERVVLRKKAIPWLTAPQHCQNAAHHSIHFSHTLYRTRHCLDVIAEHERLTNSRYSWIYRIRPDVMYLHNVSMPFELRKDTMYITPWYANRSGSFDQFWAQKNNHPPGHPTCGDPNMSDHVFIASRSIAERAFRAYDSRDLCDTYQLSDPNIAAQIRLWLCTHRIPYEILPWMFSIARDNGMCKFLDFMPHPYISNERAVKRCKIWSEIFLRVLNAAQK